MTLRALSAAPDADQIAAHLQRQRAAFMAEGPVSAALRKDRLRRCVELLKQNSDRICEVISDDFGARHPVSTLMMDVQAPIEALKYAIKHVDQWMKPQRRSGLFPFNLFGARAELRYQPKGVVGIAGTWNGPLFMIFAPLAGVFAAGNRVMAKPSDLSPHTSEWLADAVPQFFDPLEFSVVTGGLDVARSFTRQAFDHLVFTGSTGVARQIMRDAADHLVPLTLELGGKSPTIVMPDADLDHAVAGVLYGIFSSSGESCIAGSRAFVHESLYDEFKRRLLEGVKKLRVGDPSREDTQMGPLVNLGHRASVEKYVQLGRDEGGTVLCGGERPSGGYFDGGSYYLPTIFEGLPNSARMCQEEIFGPVLALLPWKDEDDLIAQCNDNMFGLASGIWTRDFKSAWRIGRALQTGTVWINTYKVFSISTPFTGVKMSGYGQEKGRLGILEYTSQKSFYWGLNESPMPWATT